VGRILAGLVTNNRNVDPRSATRNITSRLHPPPSNMARADFVSFPDLDGIPDRLGAGADLGAYER
jgi:hypothetical protein